MKRVGVIVWGASLVLTVLAASGIESPGYMDADYYFATGQQVAEGRGFTQAFLWHYLDDPTGLPHASHGYWMPLTTLVSALPMWLFDSYAFQIAQIPFILLTSLMPVATMCAAYRFHSQRRWAVLSGLMALFSGFYFIFFLTTDNFALYAWIGGLALWTAAGLDTGSQPWKWAAVGGLIGLAHLTRADGILLLIPVVWAVWHVEEGRKWTALALVLAGLVLVELPWWLRNLNVWGSILTPSNSRALWLTGYNELFAYPPGQLTPSQWLQSGFGAILQARIEALWLNLQHVLAEPGMVFLWPFVIVAVRKYRQHRWVRLSAAYFLSMLFVMTVVFPYAGGRGGVFHSSAAVLPLVWVLAPCGLVASIGWAAEKRGWNQPRAKQVFLTASILFLAILTFGLYARQILEPNESGGDWNQSNRIYEQVGTVLVDLDQDDLRIAVNNPPGFWLATGLQAVVIPDGDESTLRELVNQFEVDIVVLDRNVPTGLEELYGDPGQLGWLEVIASVQSPQHDVLWILSVVDS